MNTEPVIIKAAKKRHACTWCGTAIEPGESYVRWRWFYDGEAGTNKMHPECDKACEQMSREEGYGFEWMPGEFKRGCTCDAGDPPCDHAAAPTPQAKEAGHVQS